MNRSEEALFRRVRYLSLHFDERQPYTSLPFLRTIVDLSSVVRLTIQLLVHNFAQNSSLNDYLTSILNETVHMHTLKLTYIHVDEPLSSTQSLCALIPRSVKHLQISVIHFKEMKTILEQLRHLFSVTFYCASIGHYYDDIEKWIQLKRPNSLSRRSLRCIQIWLGNVNQHDLEKPLTKRVFSRFSRREAS